MAKHLLSHPGVWIGVLTEREHLFFTEETPATSNREGNNYTIADGQVRDLTADFNDLAHKLVTKNVARNHRRNELVVQVQVRTADRGGRDLNDGIALVQDLRIRNVFDAH